MAVSFVEQRERVIRDQQDALLELSTPVLQVRERLMDAIRFGPCARIEAGRGTLSVLRAGGASAGIRHLRDPEPELAFRFLDPTLEVADRVHLAEVDPDGDEGLRDLRGQLILPIIGVLDQDRAQQLTEQLLHGIRAHRAKLVVIDVTGVPEMDENVANSLVDTVTASRLMGADVIITGPCCSRRRAARAAPARPPGARRTGQGTRHPHRRRGAGRP